MQYIYNVEHTYLKCQSVLIGMLNFQKKFDKSKYIHIGSCSVAKIPNNTVVQTESKTNLRFERKLKPKFQTQKGHLTSHCTHASTCSLPAPARAHMTTNQQPSLFYDHWIYRFARISKQKLYKILSFGRYIGFPTVRGC